MISQRSEVSDGNLFEVKGTVAVGSLAFYDAPTSEVSATPTANGWLVGISKSTANGVTLVAGVDEENIYAFDAANISGVNDADVVAKKLVLLYIDSTANVVTVSPGMMGANAPSCGKIIGKEGARYLVKFQKTANKVI